MGQVTTKMRRTTHGFAWWCPGCEEAHPLPYEKGWTFDGNLEQPTFTPSFKHEWDQGPLDPRRTPGHHCCHYVITAGQVAYCGDCTHKLVGKTISMPDLPPHLRDG
jgi:hypothetical protein